MHISTLPTLFGGEVRSESLARDELSSHGIKILLSCAIFSFLLSFVCLFLFLFLSLPRFIAHALIGVYCYTLVFVFGNAPPGKYYECMQDGAHILPIIIFNGHFRSRRRGSEEGKVVLLFYRVVTPPQRDRRRRRRKGDVIVSPDRPCRRDGESSLVIMIVELRGDGGDITDSMISQVQ